jgi:pseudouridine synthase
MSAPERLQKIIAASGLTSRRKAEALIAEGRVTVNGQVVVTLGAKADAQRDHIKVNGKLIHRQPAKVYVLLNKPKGVLSTLADPAGRIKVTDMVRRKERIYPVGRLDYDTEGLILLTNDGEFAKLLADAGGAFPKTYEVKVRGIPEASTLDRLRSGMKLPGGPKLGGCDIRVLRSDRHAWLEVTLNQGKNREIRRMFAAVQHPVLKLRRTRIGFLAAGDLKTGQSRMLTPAEVARALRMGREAGGGKKTA